MITLGAAGKEDKCDGVRVSECASVSVCLVNTLQFFVAMESHFPLLSPFPALTAGKAFPCQDIDSAANTNIYDDRDMA